MTLHDIDGVLNMYDLNELEHHVTHVQLQIDALRRQWRTVTRTEDYGQIRDAHDDLCEAMAHLQEYWT